MMSPLLCSALWLTLVVANPATETDEPAVEAETPAASAGIDITAVVEPSSGDWAHDLPPHLVEKLTPEQLTRVLEASMQANNVEVIVPLAFFLCVLGVVIASLLARQRREHILHDTLRAMIDKGVQIPSELMVRSRPRHQDLRRGLTLTGAGIGLTVLLGISPGNEGAWAIGLMIVLIGAGYLAVWWFTRRDDARSATL